MSGEHRQHLHSQLKHIQVHNWNYTEFITFEGAMTASELEYRYTKQIHFVKINFIR